MRQFPKRPNLRLVVRKRLIDETKAIVEAKDPKAEADRIYGNARDTVWFRPVVTALRRLAGKGERCMFCSGSESSDVEHYRPKAVFPSLAMTWENYLWSCTPCNRHKLNQFPLSGAGDPILVNPLDENVWNYFYIDSFGNLTPVWDLQLDDFNYRGKRTASTIGLDRQALQESRRSRMKDLKEKVQDTLALIKAQKLTIDGAKKRVARWLKQPFQPDVADFFLNGPGKNERPFKAFFRVLKSDKR